MNSSNQNNPSNANVSRNDEPSAVRDWIIVLVISVCFFFWGLLIYYAVGDSWPPPWRYGTVPDVPGQSVYSVSQAEKRAGTAPLEGARIREQHVRGEGNGSEKPRDKGGY
jgi:hypothetical protein